MASETLRRILSVDLGILQRDALQAHEIFHLLDKLRLDADTAVDSESMRRLFDVTQAVLRVKDSEVTTAYEELERMEREGGAVKGDKRQNDEVARLKETVKRQEQLLREKASGSIRRDVQIAQEETEIWRRRYETMERELREVESNSNRTKRDNERMSEEMHRLQERIKYLENENKQFHTDVSDYQRQLQSQRESLLQQRDSEGAHTRDKDLRLKQYRDMLDELEAANSDLQQQTIDLQQKLSLATNDINETTDQLERMKAVVSESEEENVHLLKEKQSLEAKLKDVTEQQELQTVSDEQVLAVVEQKAQEWQAVLAAKDEELERCQHQLAEYQQIESAARLDQDRASVVQLTRALREKDNQVETLEGQLQLASNDINRLSDDIRIERNRSNEDGRVKQLQSELQQLEKELNEAKLACNDEKERRDNAERNVSDKDRELAELSNRMSEYEQNHYGLSNAVQEIKEWRTRAAVRDSNINTLTSQVNELESQLNELHDENDALRQKFGIELDQSVDLSQYRYRRNVEVEQQKAVNRVLKKEIERLEEERQKMKSQLIKQAMHRGERAVQLGLNTEDLVTVEELAAVSGSKEWGESEWRMEKRRLESEMSEMRMKVADGEKQIEAIHNKMATLNLQLVDAREKNKNMFVAFQELSEMIKVTNKQSSSGNLPQIIECPSLDSLLSMFNLLTDPSSSGMKVQWTAQVEHMSGRNEELRSQLVSCREETSQAIKENQRLQVELDTVTRENKVLRAAGSAAAVLQPLSLPSQVPSTHTELVGSLNEQLIAVLHSLSMKEELSCLMENELEAMKRKFSVVVHQQGILYQQYCEKVEEATENVKKLQTEKTKLEELRQQDSIKLSELQRLADSLSSTPDDQSKRLREATRKLTILKLNKKALTRHLAATQENEESLRIENKKLKADMITLETSITERLGFLQRYKEKAQFQLSVLQTTLRDSVPRHEVELTNRQYVELMEKYRDLLQKESLLVERDREMEKMRVEIDQTRNESQQLKSELQGEKERARTAEQALQRVTANTDSKSDRTEDEASYAQQLAILEMKELNEQQKAEHAVKQLELLKQHINQLEQRNGQLEDKFSELARVNLHCQRSEQMLREELSHAVTQAQHESVVESLKNARETLLTQKLEINELKEVSEVAAHQNRALEALQQSQEKELFSLRNQLRDGQSQSDEKAVIGKLHRHIVQLQVSESTAVRKLEAAQTRVLKLEAALLRLDQQCVEKDEEIYRSKLMARNRVNRLLNTIQELRKRFSGALPIAEQERFANTVRKLEESRVMAEKERKAAQKEKMAADDRLAEIKVKEQDLNELVDALKSGQGSARVVEWHDKMSEMRLDNLQLKRAVDRQQERIKQVEDMLVKREETISDLQERLSCALRDQEERDLQWEERESALEKMVEKLNQQQEDMANAAIEVERASNSLPDPTLPLANQLEHAVSKLKEYAKLKVKNKQEMDELKQKSQELQEQINEGTGVLLQKDKIITELRLRVSGQPPTSLVETAEDKSMKKALTAAQDTISDLQSLVNQKETALAKYQSILEQTRQDAKRQADIHESEVFQLHQKIHMNSEDNFGKLKQAALDAACIPQPVLPTDKQLARLSELEELLAEQDNVNSALSEKLRKSKQETSSVKSEMDQLLTAVQGEKASLEESLSTQIKRLVDEKEQLEKRLKEHSDELSILKGELSAAQEAATQAPSRTLRTLVEQLRNQLALKEKQNKSLSQALLQLRADLVATAQHSAETRANEVLESINIQQVIDTQTSELQQRIQELQTRLDKLRTELKQGKDSESSLSCRVESLLEQIKRKDNTIEKLTREVSRLQQFSNQLHAREHSLMKEDTQMMSAGKHSSSETEKLRNQIKLLKSKLDKQDQLLKEHKESMEKSSCVMASRSGPSKSQEEVIRWDENKKWQKRVESLKTKVSDKTRECESLAKQVTALKDTITRLERDRSLSQTQTTHSTEATEQHSWKTQQLKTEIFHLTEQVASLQHQLKMGPQVETEYLQTTNQQLINTVHALESQLKEMSGDGESTSIQFNALHKHQQELEDKVLVLEKDNIQLQLELENAHATVPRLQSRVADLEQYFSHLAAETSSSHQSTSGRNRISELENVVAALKRVVEKQQSENESLRRSRPSSKYSQSSLASENKKLKEELRVLKTSSTKDGGSTRLFNSSKLIAENDRLRQELKQEIERAEKLDINKAKLEVTTRQLKKQLDELHKEKSLTDQEPHFKIAEKLRMLQAELERKNGMLQEVKRHVRTAAEREKEWVKKQAELEEQVSLLQRFSEGGVSLTQLSQQLAAARQQVASYEEERLNLITEMAQLKQRNKSPLTMTENEQLSELQAERDRLRDENQQLREELKPFDPAFFEEIEDLKFHCKQAVEKNAHYEEQLAILSRQFGIAIDIPRHTDTV